MKSYFLELTSSGTADFVALDFSGAKEVLLFCTSSNGGATTLDGKIVSEPFANAQGFALGSQMIQPTIVHSTDDRLYWVSTGAYSATLQVWMVMR